LGYHETLENNLAKSLKNSTFCTVDSVQIFFYVIQTAPMRPYFLICKDASSVNCKSVNFLLTTNEHKETKRKLIFILK